MRLYQNGVLVLPKVNPTMSQRNISYFGVKIWSKLPPEVPMAASVEKFKEAIYYISD